MALRALLFDTFGTLVDWRSGVTREAERLLPGMDGSAFADAWRACYQPSMEAMRTGSRPFADLDALQAESLEGLLTQFGIANVTEVTKRDLVRAWHRLDAWPDVTPAMARLRRLYWLAPLSNGHVRLIVELARRNDLVFETVLGADFSRDYKPKPAVYRDAIAAYALEPGEILMVAAHSDDLAAAAREGLRTAHIARPREHGPGGGETGPRVPVDFAARDLGDLATQLGC